MKRTLLAMLLAVSVTGCGEDKQHDSVSEAEAVDAPSAPVEETVEIPPHKRFKNVQEACPPLPVKDGFVTVKMKVLQKDGGLEKGAGGSLKYDGEITLRLPEYARIGRKPAVYDECEYAQRIDIPYTWYKGKLIPGQGARFDIPSDYVNRRVDVSASPEKTGWLKDYKPVEAWRYALATPHQYFPLEYYPRYRWETEVGPQYRSSDSGMWGILNTKHRLLDGGPFIAGCSIKKPAIQSGRKNPPIETPMADFGDSNCGGRIAFVKNGAVLSFGIRNWKDTVPEINLIYDAVYEEVQHFVQE